MKKPPKKKTLCSTVRVPIEHNNTQSNAEIVRLYKEGWEFAGSDWDAKEFMFRRPWPKAAHV